MAAAKKAVVKKKPVRKSSTTTVAPVAPTVERITFDENDYAKLAKLPEAEKASIMMNFAQLAIELHEVDFAWEVAQQTWANAREKLDKKNESFLRGLKTKLESVK